MAKSLKNLLAPEGTLDGSPKRCPEESQITKHRSEAPDMSIKVMSLVWDHGPLKQRDRFVLLALADYANDLGECYPSIQGIAKKTCLLARLTGHDLVAATIGCSYPISPILAILADLSVGRVD